MDSPWTVHGLSIDCPSTARSRWTIPEQSMVAKPRQTTSNHVKPRPTTLNHNEPRGRKEPRRTSKKASISRYLKNGHLARSQRRNVPIWNRCSGLIGEEFDFLWGYRWFGVNYFGARAKVRLHVSIRSGVGLELKYALRLR